MLNWGSVPEISVQLGKINFTLKQDVTPGAKVGTFLWPSSVIISRYILSEKFLKMTNSHNNNNHISNNFTLNTNVSVNYTNASQNNKTAINAHISQKLSSSSSSQRPLALDLGAGCGLTTIALIAQGYDVIATDRAHVVPLLEYNIHSFLNIYNNTDISNSYNTIHTHTNGNSSHINNNNNNNGTLTKGSCPVKVIEFDWMSNEHSLLWNTTNTNTTNNYGDDEERRRFDIHRISLIICSDCIYDSFMIPSLINVLQSIHSTCNNNNKNTNNNSNNSNSNNTTNNNTTNNSNNSNNSNSNNTTTTNNNNNNNTTNNNTHANNNSDCNSTNNNNNTITNSNTHKQDGDTSCMILLANEMRSALDEFLRVARPIGITFQVSECNQQ